MKHLLDSNFIYVSYGLFINVYLTNNVQIAKVSFSANNASSNDIIFKLYNYYNIFI